MKQVLVLVLLLTLLFSFPLMAFSPEDPLRCKVELHMTCDFSEFVKDTELEKEDIYQLIQDHRWCFFCDGRTLKFLDYGFDEPVKTIWELEISKIESMGDSKNGVFKLNFKDRQDYVIIDVNMLNPGKIRIMHYIGYADFPDYIFNVSVYDCKKVDSIPMH